MQITGSSDITLLQVKIVWDISNSTPQILLENESAGPDLASCTWWYNVFAPGDIPIHEGSESNPDITGNWTDHTISDSWPKVANNILWSGSPYSFQLFVKDGDGNVYETAVVEQSICRPAGNKPTSTNTYGLATCLVEVKCADARVFFQNTTYAVYQGLDGTLGASVLRVVYPIDQDGNIPDPFVGANFSTALVPITYSSDNYQYQSYCIYQYAFDDNSFVRVRYQSFNAVNGSPAVTFAVLCNIDLCSLFCEVDKLVNSISTGNCADVEEAQHKLNLINPKLWLISMGIQQPLCGVDVPTLIEEVKEIGGFECNCCNAPTGIIPTNSSVIDGYNFQIVTGCGDVSGDVEKNGNNIQITLNNTIYTFEMCDGSPMGTTAFEFRESEDEETCVKTVCLYVDVTQLAYDILNTIKENAALVNLFNSIVVGQGTGQFQLIVDGKCIFSNNNACDYTFTLSNIPSSGTFALLTGIALNTTDQTLNFAFNKTNLPALQAYLNTLGLGFFVVLEDGSNVVIITEDNTNNILSLNYSLSGTNYEATMNKTCEGYTPLTANQVVQYIIDYLCGLDDTEVVTSIAYEICYIDPKDGESKTITIGSGEELSTFITALLAAGCQTIEYIQSLTPPDCEGMKEFFPESKATMQSNDYFFGTKNNECARVFPTEAFLRMLELGIEDESVVTAFCAIVDKCRGSKTCPQYAQFTAELIEYDENCPIVIKANVEGDAPITITEIQWANVPVGAQTVTVEYIDAASALDNWTVAGSSTVTSAGTLGTLDTPIALTGATDGHYYYIRVYNDCDSPPQYSDEQGPYLAAPIP